MVWLSLWLSKAHSLWFRRNLYEVKGQQNGTDNPECSREREGIVFS